MKKLKLILAVVPILACLALVAAGCGADTATNSKAASSKPAVPTCPAKWRPGWQQLANRIHAAVYCPAWVPDPLTGQIVGQVSFGGAGGPAVSVSPDRSYLVSLAWAEPQSGEVHVNLRGYPGRIKVPTCIYEDYNHGKIYRKPVPCFSDARGTAHERGITATVYTVNQDADLWHVLYAWHYRGGLYTLSEHVAVPLTYAKVVANLHHMLRDLVLVDPTS
jgi:hypothetical protein